MTKRKLRRVLKLKPIYRFFCVKDNIHNFFQEISAARHRAVYGVSPRDCWDLDDYFLDVLENGLTIYKEETNGYPGHLTEEEWDNVLRYMIGLIREIRIDGTECPRATRIWDAYHDSEGMPKEDWNEFSNDWFTAVKEWDEHRQECVDMLFDLMKEYFFGLWW